MTIQDILAQKELPKLELSSLVYEVTDVKREFSAKSDKKERLTDIYVKPQHDPSLPFIDIEPNLPVYNTYY